MTIVSGVMLYIWWITYYQITKIWILLKIINQLAVCPQLISGWEMNVVSMHFNYCRWVWENYSDVPTIHSRVGNGLVLFLCISTIVSEYGIIILVCPQSVAGLEMDYCCFYAFWLLSVSTIRHIMQWPENGKLKWAFCSCNIVPSQMISPPSDR